MFDYMDLRTLQESISRLTKAHLVYDEMHGDKQGCYAYILKRMFEDLSSDKRWLELNKNYNDNPMRECNDTYYDIVYSFLVQLYKDNKFYVYTYEPLDFIKPAPKNKGDKKNIIRVSLNSVIGRDYSFKIFGGRVTFKKMVDKTIKLGYDGLELNCGVILPRELLTKIVKDSKQEFYMMLGASMLDLCVRSDGEKPKK